MGREYNAFSLFLSLRRNVNFWSWVRYWYSDDDLLSLKRFATDIILTHSYDWLHDYQAVLRGDYMSDVLTGKLMGRYGDEIIRICLSAGGFSIDEGLTGIGCLARLDLAHQVHNRATLNQFLVRNALKTAAEQVLAGGRPRR